MQAVLQVDNKGKDANSMEQNLKAECITVTTTITKITMKAPRKVIIINKEMKTDPDRIEIMKTTTTNTIKMVTDKQVAPNKDSIRITNTITLKVRMKTPRKVKDKQDPINKDSIKITKTRRITMKTPRKVRDNKEQTKADTIGTRNTAMRTTRRIQDNAKNPDQRVTKIVVPEMMIPTLDLKDIAK